MPIRVVARIRPVLGSDLDPEVIVHPVAADQDGIATTVRVASPQEDGGESTFNLDGVYSSEVSQEAFFNVEGTATTTT